MDVAAGSDGNGEFRGIPVLGDPGATSQKLVRACGWCQKVEVDGTWKHTPVVEAEAPLVTHGICPSCHSDLTEALARHRAGLALGA